MASKYYYLSGVTKWCQRLRNMDEKYKNYQLNLYMDDKSWELFNDLGLGLKKREDEDGKFVTLKRPDEKVMKGELVHLGAPKVFDASNQPWGNQIIGNGSEVTAKIVVYDTIKGPGHRLESVRVDKWVEYNRPAEDAAPAGAAAGPAIPF